MKIANGETAVFTGDSITDCGRIRPVGRRGGLGNGYVSLVNSLIETSYPEIQVRVLNTGISGNRIIDLATRWEDDVLKLSPDWVSVFIGINDVWRQFDSPALLRQVGKAEFEETYRRLIERTRAKVKGLILMTPFFLETNRSDPIRKMMDEYGLIVSRLSEEYETVLADVQSAFDAFLKYKPTQLLCGDRVHPDLTGHTIITRCLLTALGFEWNPGLAA